MNALYSIFLNGLNFIVTTVSVICIAITLCVLLWIVISFLDYLLEKWCE